jgi:hypothetical protein
MLIMYRLFEKISGQVGPAKQKTYGAACQIIIELSETSLIAEIILFAKCYLRK